MKTVCMVKDAWQMLYRTQEWLPWISNLCKNMLGNIATLDMKAQLWIHFLYTLPLVQHFIQPEYTGGWSLYLEITRKRLHLFHASGDIHYAKLVHLNHLKLCTLQDRHRQGWIPFLHRGRLLCHPMKWQALGDVWSDMTTEQVSDRLTWKCRITENTLAKWVGVSLYTPCTPTEEPIGSQAESCEACHHKDLTPAQQADLGQPNRQMWSIEAHLLLYGHYHGNLVSLSTGITGDSSVNWHNAEEVGQQLQ